jgi:uncharacterized protein DUF542
MGQTSGCGCRHGTSPRSGEAVQTVLAPVTAADTVEATARRSPHGLPILQRFGIDTCCGGHLTLAQASGAAGVPVETVLRALEPAKGTK